MKKKLIIVILTIIICTMAAFKIVSIQKNNILFDTAYNEGIASLKSSKLDEAAAYFNKCISLKPKNMESQNALAFVNQCESVKEAYEENDYEKAKSKISSAKSNVFSSFLPDSIIEIENYIEETENITLDSLTEDELDDLNRVLSMIAEYGYFSNGYSKENQNFEQALSLACAVTDRYYGEKWTYNPEDNNGYEYYEWISDDVIDNISNEIFGIKIEPESTKSYKYKDNKYYRPVAQGATRSKFGEATKIENTKNNEYKVTFVQCEISEKDLSKQSIHGYYSDKDVWTKKMKSTFSYKKSKTMNATIEVKIVDNKKVFQITAINC